MPEIKTKDNKIFVSHFNIKQSISVLLIKLVLVDIISALLFLIIFSSEVIKVLEDLNTLRLFGFMILVIFKVGLTMFLVLQWLNEYWEITAEKIVHRRGIIWKSEKTLSLDKVRELKISQGFIGELLNLGTIVLFDLRLNRYMDMYMVHNPRKYLKILEDIIPAIEEETETAGSHLTKLEE